MGKKTPKVKASTAKSAYNGVNNYNVDFGPFGSATSQKSGNAINTSFTPSAGMSNLYNTASSGLNTNLGALSQTPTQQLQDLQAGNNSYYNLNSEVNKRALTDQMGQAQSHFSQSGLENSTAYGGFQGALQGNANLQDLATRQASLEYQNQQANQNASTQSSVLQGLANIQAMPTQLANQDLQTGFGSQDQIGMFNASQLQSASAQNAQLQQQANAARSAMIGNLISAGASIAAAPFTGGTSLIGAMGSLGKAFGGSGSASSGLGGGSGVPSLGSYFSSPAMNPASSLFVGNLSTAGLGGF